MLVGNWPSYSRKQVLTLIRVSHGRETFYSGMGKEVEVIKILQLSSGKKVYIQGKSITTDEAHEIIIRLTKTWGNDFDKGDLKDLVLDC